MFDKNICSFAPLPLFVYLMKDNTGSFELAPCKNVTLLHSTALILIDTKPVPFGINHIRYLSVFDIVVINDLL